MHVGDYATLTQMLSPHCLGVLVRLENSSFSQGTGTLKFDEKALARVAGTAVNKLRQAVKEILAWCGDLCRAVGDVLHFPRAISELAYSEARSAIARANRQAGLAKKPKLGSKICPSMKSDLKPSFDKKSNEINDDASTTVEQRSDSSPLHKESSLRSDSESAKADSCQPAADDPMAGLEPQPQRAAGAGPSKPASGAGCTNPDPQPAESQRAAPDGAGSPPSSAAPLSRKRKPKKQATENPPPMDDDWVPKEKTLQRIMEARGVSHKQAELQAEKFRNSVIATNNKYGYVRFDQALINWVIGEHYRPVLETTDGQARPSNVAPDYLEKLRRRHAREFEEQGA